jgi:hypothetical protein
MKRNANAYPQPPSLFGFAVEIIRYGKPRARDSLAILIVIE